MPSGKMILQSRIRELVVVPLQHAAIEPDPGRVGTDRFVEANHVLGRFVGQQQYLAEIVQQCGEDEFLAGTAFVLHGIEDLQHMQLLAHAVQTLIRRVDALGEHLDRRPHRNGSENRRFVFAAQACDGLQSLRAMARLDVLGVTAEIRREGGHGRHRRDDAGQRAGRSTARSGRGPTMRQLDAQCARSELAEETGILYCAHGERQCATRCARGRHGVRRNHDRARARRRRQACSSGRETPRSHRRQRLRRARCRRACASTATAAHIVSHECGSHHRIRVSFHTAGVRMNTGSSQASTGQLLPFPDQPNDDQQALRHSRWMRQASRRF